MRQHTGPVLFDSTSPRRRFIGNSFVCRILPLSPLFGRFWRDCLPQVLYLQDFGKKGEGWGCPLVLLTAVCQSCALTCTAEGGRTHVSSARLRHVGLSGKVSLRLRSASCRLLRCVSVRAARLWLDSPVARSAVLRTSKARGCLSSRAR